MSDRSYVGKLKSALKSERGCGKDGFIEKLVNNLNIKTATLNKTADLIWEPEKGQWALLGGLGAAGLVASALPMALPMLRARRAAKALSRSGNAAKVVEGYTTAANRANYHPLARLLKKLDTKINPRKADHHNAFFAGPAPAIRKWMSEAGSLERTPDAANSFIRRLEGGEPLKELVKDDQYRNLLRRMAVEKRPAAIGFGNAAFTTLGAGLAGLGVAGYGLSQSKNSPTTVLPGEKQAPTTTLLRSQRAERSGSY